jgi:AcrR family transcriptional regulator
MNGSINNKKVLSMARTKAANQPLREAQRAKILDAAKSVFARKGMAATMADIAAAAQMSQGLAYHYFASKEDIVHQLVEQTLQTAPAAWQHFFEISSTPGERLALLVSRLVQNRRDHPELYQLLDQLQSSETTPADLRERIEQQSQTFHNVVRQLIVEGQATGEVGPGNPDQLVTAIAACLEGLTRLASHNLEQFKRYCPDADILLRMLKP